MAKLRRSHGVLASLTMVATRATRLSHLLLAAPRRRITSRHTLRRPLTHPPAATGAAWVRHNQMKVLAVLLSAHGIGPCATCHTWRIHVEFRTPPAGSRKKTRGAWFTSMAILRRLSRY